jgi:zinc protease
MHFPFTRYRITFQFGSDPERVKELTTEIFTQIDSLKNFGTTTEYLQKVQEIQLREYETNLKRNSFWLSNLEYKYYHGESVEDILTYKDLVNHLTLEKIQQAAKKYINKNNYVRVVLYPELEKSAMKE